MIYCRLVPESWDCPMKLVGPHSSSVIPNPFSIAKGYEAFVGVILIRNWYVVVDLFLLDSNCYHGGLKFAWLGCLNCFSNHGMYIFFMQVSWIFKLGPLRDSSSVVYQMHGTHIPQFHCPDSLLKRSWISSSSDLSHLRC